MKNQKGVASAAAIVVAAALTAPLALAQNGNGNGNGNASNAIPSIPVGSMKATPTVVQTGTHPTLAWSILYPSKVSDVATITPPGTITMTETMYVSIRPVGVGVTGSNGGADIDNIHAESRVSINGSSYAQLFYGTDDDVDPAYSLYIKKLHKGTTIDLGGRYVEDGKWTSFFTTRSSNQQVISLVNGDTVPTTFDLNKSDKVAKYVKPYLDASGKVNVGPLSVLVLMELAETDHSNGDFDYQDVALLVSFSANHTNNGHGNNLDGVDSSNPGAGSGGPNGKIDPSGGVDDERR